MSDIIQLLPDSVANQIAAGEVIQRPSSVVKELMENAVDAGATHIDVMVTDAGRTSIRVIDNGKGMSETDARMSFERHATSKIRKAADLFNLTTMGFRGEALSSIAAVAQVELLTRTADDEIGTMVSVSASRVTAQEPAACPVGSDFYISNLFFNVPARRKFLKSDSTELNNIIQAFCRVVLVYPNINFTLSSNGQEVMNLPAGNLHQRVSDVFGTHLRDNLLTVNVKTVLCDITGFVGKPEAARRRIRQQFFFVNGRYMRHPYFHKAVTEAYQRLLPEGLQPPYFIYFNVDPNDIDVNIHPTKTEIKFENEQAIWQILAAAVKDAIGRFSEIPTIDFDTRGAPDIPLLTDEDRQSTPPGTLVNKSYNPFNEGTAEKLLDLYKQNGHTLRETGELSPQHYQYKGRWVMTAVKSGLMIIDQHRADQRVLYDRYMKKNRHKRTTPQQLLFPEKTTLSAQDMIIFETLRHQLEDMGFRFSAAAEGEFLITAVPTGGGGVGPITLLHDIIDDAENDNFSTPGDIHERLARCLARQMAIPYGQVLTNDEMENLVNELFASQNINYSPDGKIILAILPQDEIERLMG